MPTPRCGDCGNPITPQDRVTLPAETDYTGTLRPRETWHKECLANEADAVSEVMEEDAGEEEGRFSL